MSNQFRGLSKKSFYSNDEPFFKQIVEVVNNILKGKLNCTGTMTVQPSTTSTTVIDIRTTAESCITITALDANSANTINFYLSSRTSGESFTFSHDSVLNVRNYCYIIIG